MSDFIDLCARAAKVRALYAAHETRTHGRPWTREELALGFVGDVGDLATLVQAMEGVRAIPDAKTKLAHELADCLWSLMTLADAYDVDLEQAFTGTMTELEARLAT